MKKKKQIGDMNIIFFLAMSMMKTRSPCTPSIKQVAQNNNSKGIQQNEHLESKKPFKKKIFAVHITQNQFAK